MDKILTIIIPTYNMENYLSYCLDSLLIKENLEGVEVLVINDGSKDASSRIAHTYADQHPQTFQVIDKENGNYGSCVNRGLAEASGKYVKILDADDSFDKDNFEAFITFLKETDADLVVSDFAIVDEDRNVKRMVCHEFPSGCIPLDKICTTESFSHIQMHALTYRRDVLSKLSYKQTEGISYTDQEWVFTPMAGVKSVGYFDKCVYKYLVGREGQTVNPAVKAKRMPDVCQCVYAMSKAYEQYRNNISEQLRMYFYGRLDYMIREVYVFGFLHYSVQNRNLLVQFDTTLKSICPEIYDWVAKGNSKFNYIRFWRNHSHLTPVLVRGGSWCYCRILLPFKRVLFACRNYNQTSMLKKIAKLFIPSGLHSCIRKRLIMMKHRKVASMLSGMVEDCNAGRLEKPVIKALVELPKDKKVIWQYWAQGMENVPPLVRICLDSVDKYAADYHIIRLSDSNLANYIEIPDWLKERKQQMSAAHFSDLLRCMLLSVYGGLWLDAATLLTGRLPDMLFRYDFFAYQRDFAEPHKKYWENSFAYYWGWDKNFRVNILIGIMYAKAGSQVISDMVTMLCAFWKYHDRVPDYFFFQILFDIYIKENQEKNCPIFNDCVPHMLRQVINAEYPYLSVHEILEKTSIHSLNYKNPKAADNLRILLADIR